MKSVITKIQDYSKVNVSTVQDLTMIQRIAMKEKTMRTEEEIKNELKALYAERTKIRKKVWAEYVGKCYLINETYYKIDRILDRAFGVLVIDDERIGIEEMEIPLDQWKDYEIPSEQFIKALESRVDLIIKQIKEKQ
jgi:hypothetical protein